MKKESRGWRFEKVGAGNLLFPPDKESSQQAREAIFAVIHQSPKQHGYDRSRWTLTLLRQVLDWLSVSTDPGMYQILDRLGISYKKGRLSMTSPDPNYQTKQTRIISLRESTKTNESAVMLYQDEVTYYRAPSTARSYGASGSVQPTARVDHSTHRSARIAAAMDAHSGRVEYIHHTSMGTDNLICFYEQIAEAYSNQNQIYMVQDNWPVHFHSAVMRQLETQYVADHFPVTDNWESNTEAVQADGPIPIQVIPLPTYAPWLNPIEKLWRWLKQQVIHMHSFGQAWSTLKRNVQRFLDQFSTGSNELLEYTGLLPQ